MILSLILGTRFLILGTWIGSLKHLKKPVLVYNWKRSIALSKTKRWQKNVKIPKLFLFLMQVRNRSICFLSKPTSCLYVCHRRLRNCDWNRLITGEQVKNRRTEICSQTKPQIEACCIAISRAGCLVLSGNKFLLRGPLNLLSSIFLTCKPT